MKTCPNCNKEVEDNLTFCPYCGVEIASTKKKLSYFEKKEAKDRERQELLSKSYLQKENVENADLVSPDCLSIVKFGDINSEKKKTIIILVAVCLGFVCGIVGAKVIGEIDINANIKLISILGIFIACAYFLSIILSKSYYMHVIMKMKNSNYAVKKVNYGEGPILLNGTNMYKISVDVVCDKCGNKQHLEEQDGVLFIVCDSDRSHLKRVDMTKLHEMANKQN